MPYYVQLDHGQPGALGGEIPAPQPDWFPHFSYGIQWIVLGTLAPVAFVCVTCSQAKHLGRAAGRRH